MTPGPGHFQPQCYNLNKLGHVFNNATSNKIDASLIGNQKCDNTDDNVDGDMIPVCLPCFASDTITLVQINKKIFEPFLGIIYM